MLLKRLRYVNCGVNQLDKSKIKLLYFFLGLLIVKNAAKYKFLNTNQLFHQNEDVLKEKKKFNRFAKAINRRHYKSINTCYFTLLKFITFNIA